MFFNTTKIVGDVLKEYKRKNNTQNKKVLGLFERHPDALFTPCSVQSVLCMEDVPLTSIRRSITTLTKQGYLIKTPVRRLGNYGRLNYLWRLNGDK